MQRIRLVSLLSSRLQIEETYRAHPSIEAEEVEGPVFVIGYPAPEQRRSASSWPPIPSSAPSVSGSPRRRAPAESTTEHTDPRIADTEAGLAMMNQMFPLMQAMHMKKRPRRPNARPARHELPHGALRRVWTSPLLLAWVTDCDMLGTTATTDARCASCSGIAAASVAPEDPVHMFALDALLEAYPNARFLWSHVTRPRCSAPSAA